MFVCQAVRQSDGMVPNVDHTAVCVLFVCNRLLSVGNATAVDTHGHNDIGHSREYSATHRDPSQDQNDFGGNFIGQSLVQRLDGWELSEFVLPTVAVRDITMDVSRWDHCQFAMGSVGSGLVQNFF